MHCVYIVMNELEHNQFNYCLNKLIEEIGKPYSANTKDEKANYKAGVSFINKRLHKRNKTAIKNLVYAKKKKYNHPGITETRKYVWKIHKRKAEKIFKVLYAIVSEMEKQETKALFKMAYKNLKKYGVLKQGDDLIAFPYYPDLKAEPELSAVDDAIKTFRGLYN